MKTLTRSITLLITATSFALTAQASYWQDDFRNTQNHFYSGYPNQAFVDNWVIASTDQYITGRFFVYPTVFSIKPGQQYMNLIQWPYYPWVSVTEGGDTLGNQWLTHTNDIHAKGRFYNTDYDALLIANPNGNYTTFEYDQGAGDWSALQSANNGNIDAGDQLVAGDFDGDNYDELMLIKTNGSHYTMKFNLQTHNWDITSSSTAGSIHWWRINTASDQYIAGDYDGDGRDELLAINPNGWHHTMRFNNNQWHYIEGGSPSNGSVIAYWNVTTPNSQYISADFDNDNKDELIAINTDSGWSHKMNLATNGAYPQWKYTTGNAGNGKLSTQWSIMQGDRYKVFGEGVNGDKYKLLAINPNGHVGMLKH